MNQNPGFELNPVAFGGGSGAPPVMPGPPPSQGGFPPAVGMGAPPSMPPPQPVPPSSAAASIENDFVPPGLAPGTNAVRTRDLLYRLMVSQLFYDGYQSVAVQLTNLLQADPPCPPSDRLFHVASLGLEREAENKHRPMSAPEKVLGPGLDLEFETEMPSAAPEPALYETAYVTSHKGNCRAGAFSPDGNLCATGSLDTSIKILDVDRMLAKSSQDTAKMAEQGPGGHPVIRTLYDHLEEVTCLDFHPKETILASGSRDCTVKLFDYSKASAKKAARSLNDADPVSSISFHPSGDFLVVGTMGPIIHMYDSNTGQCFVGARPEEQHKNTVSCVKWSPDGRLYVSCSLDGHIKVWDGVSSRCVATFQDAHDRFDVCSVAFTRNGKYVLSAGKESTVKLWELSTTRCLIAYTGAGATGKQEYHAQAVLNHSEDYVMFPDEATTSLCCWDARNASRKQLLSLGHNGVVRYIVHSPTAPAFLTCSDDFRARFWFHRQ